MIRYLRQEQSRTFQMSQNGVKKSMIHIHITSSSFSCIQKWFWFLCVQRVNLLVKQDKKKLHAFHSHEWNSNQIGLYFVVVCCCVRASREMLCNEHFTASVKVMRKNGWDRKYQWIYQQKQHQQVETMKNCNEILIATEKIPNREKWCLKSSTSERDSLFEFFFCCKDAIDRHAYECECERVLNEQRKKKRKLFFRVK